MERNSRETGGGSDSYSLSPDQLVVNDYDATLQADARIQVNLGFDFMAEYNPGSTEQFEISATVSNSNLVSQTEVFYLSSGFTADPPVPIPEPGTMVLFSVVLAAAFIARRKWRKRKGSQSSDNEPTAKEDGSVGGSLRKTADGPLSSPSCPDD